MEYKKLPNELEIEELLKIIENNSQDDNNSENKNDYLLNDVLKFIQAFDIKNGEHKIRYNVLYKLYSLWSKEPINRINFSKEFDNYFIPECKGKWKYYKINISPFVLSDKTLKLIQERSIDKTKSKNYKKHFDSFLKFYDLCPGKTWIKSETLYYLYDKWTYKNKNNNPLGYKQFLSFCKLFFKNKRITENRMMWFGINKTKLFKKLPKEEIEKITYKTKKKKKKRDLEKYPALKPELNLKSRYDELDFDYLDKLNEKELKFLNDFVSGYIHASINKSNEYLFKTKSARKECYDRNNTRNRDIYTKAKTGGVLDNIDNITDLGIPKEERNVEDDLIDLLDLKEYLNNKTRDS